MRWRRRAIPLATALLGIFVATAASTALADSGYPSGLPNPAMDGNVSDYASVLPPGQRRRAEDWLNTVVYRTGTNIVVMTVGSLRDYRAHGYSTGADLARGLLARQGSYRGPRSVVLLVSVQDGKAWIELGEAYADRRDEAERILATRIEPELARGRHAAAVLAGTKALMWEFAGVRAGKSILPLLAFTVVIVAGPIALSVFRNGKNGWGWVCVGTGIVLALLARRVLRSPGRGPAGSREVIGGGATGSW